MVSCPRFRKLRPWNTFVFCADLFENLDLLGRCFVLENQFEYDFEKVNKTSLLVFGHEKNITFCDWKNCLMWKTVHGHYFTNPWAKLGNPPWHVFAEIVVFSPFFHFFRFNKVLEGLHGHSEVQTSTFRGVLRVSEVQTSTKKKVKKWWKYDDFCKKVPGGDFAWFCPGVWILVKMALHSLFSD